MRDKLGRTIDYMRISVTDRCNLRCGYCMPHPVPRLPHRDILRYEEIERVAKAAVSLGIVNFKITGGEPLARQSCAGLVARLKAIPGVGRVSLTTNGVLLRKALPALRSAGLDAVTISLDTLRPGVYAKLTGAPALGEVLEALDASLASGLQTKVNCVPMQGVNEEDIVPLARLAQRPVDVRFIEIMPVGAAGGYTPMPPAKVLAQISKAFGPLAQSYEKRGYGPAVYYTSERLQGGIGFINAVSHRFCQSCNRVRLSSTGRLRLCLYHEDGTDLRAPLRGGASAETLTAILQKAIYQKPEQHAFGGSKKPLQAGLYTIGG